MDRARAAGGGLGHVQMERGGDFVSMVTPVEPEVFKLVAARLCVETGVTLLLHTIVDEVHASAGHIEDLTIWNKSGRSLVRARQYVDCSGDGDVAAYAGASCIHFGAQDRGAYSAGFTFRLCNVDLAALEADLDRRGLISQLAHAVKPGTSRPDLVRLGIDMGRLRAGGAEDAPGYFLSSSLRPREITYCNCINYGPVDALDAGDLSAAELALRERMFVVAELFRREFAGCRDCYVAGPAPAVGPRRARAVRAQYELSAEDCVSGRQFDDQIGCFAFIDNSRYFVRDAGAYGIPYRALLPQGADNLLMAGRMMTVDLVAHNSTRNTVSCLVWGQAAGTAAALAVAADRAPAEIDYDRLRQALLAAAPCSRPMMTPSTRRPLAEPHFRRSHDPHRPGGRVGSRRRPRRPGAGPGGRPGRGAYPVAGTLRLFRRRGSYGMGMPINQMRPDGRPRGAVHELILARLQAYGDDAVQVVGHALVCNTTYLQVAAMDALEEVGCDYLLHSRVVGALTEGERVTGVTLATKTGLQPVRAQVVVDASGDADVAYLAGAETLKGRPEDGFLSPMTLCLLIANVDVPAARAFNQADPGLFGFLARAKNRYPLLPDKMQFELGPFPLRNCLVVNHAGTKALGVLDGTEPAT